MTKIRLNSKKDKGNAKHFLLLFKEINKYFYKNKLRLDYLYYFPQKHFVKNKKRLCLLGLCSKYIDGKTSIFLNSKYEDDLYEAFVHELSHLIQITENKKVVHNKEFHNIRNQIKEQLLNLWNQKSKD